MSISNKSNIKNCVIVKESFNSGLELFAGKGKVCNNEVKNG